uniref:Cadherin domain-containing protein n=1 Tax=Panagrellus redivivus TaxID=6233 RepID=A0A7E4ZRH6_PANRE
MEIYVISHPEVYYTNKPLQFDAETGVVIPSDNVALNEKHAVGIEGGDPEVLINCSLTRGSSTYHEIGKDPIIVQLPQPYLLGDMKLLVNDADSRAYSYNIEVSTD